MMDAFHGRHRRWCKIQTALWLTWIQRYTSVSHAFEHLHAAWDKQLCCPMVRLEEVGR